MVCLMAAMLPSMFKPTGLLSTAVAFSRSVLRLFSFKGVVLLDCEAELAVRSVICLEFYRGMLSIALFLLGVFDGFIPWTSSAKSTFEWSV